MNRAEVVRARVRARFANARVGDHTEQRTAAGGMLLALVAMSVVGFSVAG